ncbi:tyramine beta-hydroxylase isoform X2 [Patella vulgata]|nr:tyramine beta-hydroxylase isoform X2 [Patella vulgata]XP_050389760.1 tyramine beta-hydroxylase isoform X2 [Patella vulgata]XP_050389761.1 tyramine beta-hydroxylase isoform X2 [Patella vulgata]XP_055959266.1 tyramine beta-hydroxylase isoform X2 [Patella vulgata]
MFFYATFLLFTSVLGYGNYRLRIPNGDKVPDPCNPSKIWRGVGHLGADGGGARNPFGVDFEKHGKLWTRLCKLDSDGDGMTNGEELGDPRCVWAPGMVPPKAKKTISHPGICEPWNSTFCQEKNKWLSCEERKLTCHGLEDPNVRNLTLKFPQRMLVPPRETNYFCMIFDIPSDRDYHLVATQPVIDNREVVHHVLAFGCNIADSQQIPSSPYPCAMLAHPNCLEIIATWTLGSAGECANPDVGFRLGKTGYKKVALQIHWNNPLLLSTLMDASGLRLYYTPNLRANDAGMLVVGQDFIQLNPQPVHSPPVQVTSVCAAKCTKEMFKTPIYITAAINHMHYHGISQIISLYRNGSKVRDITNDLVYSYDSPIINTFNPPIEILPGDEIRTECNYRSPTDGDPVCFGDGTQNEMCYGFITYYPIHRLLRPWCTTRRSVESCQRHLPRFQNGPIDGCHWKRFLTEGKVTILPNILQRCYNENMTTLECSDTCKQAVKMVRQHKCLNGDIGGYIVMKLRLITAGRLFLNAIDICDCSQRLDLGYCDRRIERALIGDQKYKYCTAEGQSRKYDSRQNGGNVGQVIVDELESGVKSTHTQYTVFFVVVFCILLK